MSRTVLAYIAGVVNALALAALAVLVVGLVNPSRSSDAEGIAAGFGVTIVWDVSMPGCGSGGCAFASFPDTIFVSPDMSDQETHRVVLHELGHIVQIRLGLPNDECGADRFAASLGAGWGTYCPVSERSF